MASKKYSQGEEYYSEKKFGEAIQIWEQALALIPEEQKFAAWRASLFYSLAMAHRRSYDEAEDPNHLAGALDYLDKYLQTIDVNDEESRAAAIRQQAEIRQILAKTESSAPASEPSLLSPKPTLEDITSSSQKPITNFRKRERSLWISGGVLTGVGAGLLGTMAYFSYYGYQLEKESFTLQPGVPEDDERSKVIAREGRLTRKLVPALGIPGGIMLASGISALVWAAVIHVKHPSKSRRVAVHPWGVSLHF